MKEILCENFVHTKRKYTIHKMFQCASLKKRRTAVKKKTTAVDELSVLVQSFDAGLKFLRRSLCHCHGHHRRTHWPPRA